MRPFRWASLRSFAALAPPTGKTLQPLLPADTGRCVITNLTMLLEGKNLEVDYLLKKYCPRIEFDSYEDFFENFEINVPEAFNFGFDVVDEWARVEPQKRALLWCDDHGQERIFTFTDVSRLSNQAANAFRNMGIGKGDVVMMILRRRWEYWICAVALCKLGATIIPATLQLTKKDIAYRANAAQVKMMICVNDDYVCAQTELALP